MPDSPTFDAVTIAETVEELRPAYPAAAQLIEDLWSEVQRTRHPDFIGTSRPMDERDQSGPFLPGPLVDVEFVDDSGAACGQSTVGLQTLINDHGLLIISETHVGFMADRDLNVGGYRVWFGSDVLETVIDPVPLAAGESYMLAFNLPIKLGRDIGHYPGGNNGPPRPMPPNLSKRIVKGDA